jgi:hypothetical protein
MLVRPDEQVPLARLLTFLEYGERLAHDCAFAQSALAPQRGMQRFLASQARQESAHAWVFHGAIAWLAPRHIGDSPFLPALEQYRALLEDALQRRDMPETLMAEQLILEGLGEAILGRIEEGLVKRDAPFGSLRRVLLAQEEAHHDFGRRMLDRAFAAGATSPDALRVRAQEYLALTDRMVSTLGDLFESIDEDPKLYMERAKSYLPAWLIT